MEIKYLLREASWRTAHQPNSYPSIECLTSQPIIFLYKGTVYTGYYHVNGCFYSKEGTISYHGGFDHKEVVMWAYSNEVVISDF